MCVFYRGRRVGVKLFLFFLDAFVFFALEEGVFYGDLGERRYGGREIGLGSREVGVVGFCELGVWVGRDD